MANSYIDFKSFAEALGLKNVQRVYRWEREGYLATVVVDGVKMIERAYADKIAFDWLRSCSMVEATRRTGIPKGSRRHFIRMGVLKVVNSPGDERVLLSCIEESKAYYKLKPKRQQEQARKNGRKKWEGQKIANLYHPVSRMAREKAGKQRWVTVPEAGKFLGLPSHMVPIMFFKRTRIDCELLLDADLVEKYKKSILQ